MNLRSIVRDIVENVTQHYYFLDHEGYYLVPDPSRFIESLISKEALVKFFQVHLANLEATRAKAEMEKMGLDKYDYPEGIDKVIRGANTLMNLMERALISRLGASQEMVDDLKNVTLKNGHDLIGDL